MARTQGTVKNISRDIYKLYSAQSKLKLSRSNELSGTSSVKLLTYDYCKNPAIIVYHKKIVE